MTFFHPQEDDLEFVNHIRSHIVPCFLTKHKLTDFPIRNIYLDRKFVDFIFEHSSKFARQNRTRIRRVKPCNDSFNNDRVNSNSIVSRKMRSLQNTAEACANFVFQENETEKNDTNAYENEIENEPIICTSDLTNMRFIDLVDCVYDLKFQIERYNDRCGFGLLDQTDTHDWMSFLEIEAEKIEVVYPDDELSD